MAITAGMIKELREITGAGMMDCKKALNETNGDIEEAKTWLRKKGLSKAAKKAGRVAAEGLVAIKIEGNKGVAVEVNSETDFVSKNAEFQAFVTEIADCAFENNGDMEKVKADKEEVLTNKIATIGEHMTLRRSEMIEGDNLCGYVHSSVADNMGKIAVIVALKGGDEELGKKVAMHIAAANPMFATIDEVDPAVLEKEKNFIREQSLASGKPAEIVEKMLEGRIRKYYEEIVLVEQTFVMDTDKKIKDILKEAGAELIGYIKLALGEGIEKKEENFAEEVAKTAAS